MLDVRERRCRSSTRGRGTTRREPQDIMEGAVWRDPERLDEWIGELSKTEPVVTFCVYGFHVGCQTAIDAAQGGLRRALHGGRPLRLEGDRRQGQGFFE